MIEKGTPLQEEIRQTRPFRLPAEEASLDLFDQRQHPILNGVVAVFRCIEPARVGQLTELPGELRAGDRPDVDS